MINRRDFLNTAGVAAATSRSILGANEQVNFAVIGIGGRGRGHVDGFAKLPNCKIAAVCDVNQAAQERAVAQVEKLQGHKPKVYADMRRLFDDKEIDAVSTATPNHWHALTTIWGCQAGKHVYVEKPACHNVFEGRKMIEAARKYNRMVQVGSQGRSMPHIIEAVRLLREGAIRKVYMAKGLCYKRRKSIGRTPDEPVPAGVNWDLFLGPAQMKPYSKNKFAYNWHWFWDTGNGDIGNQGVHEMDMARWGLGKPGLPNWVFSSGGKFIYDDDQETPNTQLATFGYGDSQLYFEVRGILTGEECAVDRGGTNVVGDYFLGADGYLSVAFGGCKVFKGEKNELASEHKPESGRENRHFANFLQAVRSGNYKDLNADVEVGVMSACLCHLANISYRLGRKLAFNPDTWTFVSDSEANRMLTREYRKPYVVPDRV